MDHAHKDFNDLISGSNLLEHVFTSVTELTYAFDLDIRLTYANKNLLRILGMELEEVIGKNPYQLNYPTVLSPRLEEQVQKAISTRRKIIDEIAFTDQHGITHFYSYILSPLLRFDGSVEGVVGSSQDITRNRQNEAALTTAKDRFRALVMASSDVLYRISPDWNEIHKIHENGLLKDLTEPERNWIEHCIHPDDQELMRSKIRAAIESRQICAMDYRSRKQDGDYAWASLKAVPIINEKNEIIEWFGAASDITIRKKAEESQVRLAAEALAAAEANAKFRTFFEQGAYFATVMSTEGVVIEANRISLEACGYEPNDVTGRKFWDCGWWGKVENIVASIKEGTLQAASGKHFQIETSYFLRSGSERFVELSIIPVMDDNQNVLFIASTATDITERKQLVDAERAARAEAERAGRMKDDFLATLSHELRTPLNAISGWSQILKRKGRLDEDYEKGMAAIERNAKIQAQLIEDLLDMNGIVSGKVRLELTETILSEVINAALEAIRPTANLKEVQIEKNLDNSLYSVHADPGRLQQIISNLLNNAIKFTPSGGKVRIELRSEEAGFRISVSDTGKGISPDFLPFVFDRFRQQEASSTRSAGGLGLGLAIVKQLVELHNGKVECHSDGEGHGSTFSVILPFTADAAASACCDIARHRGAAFSDTINLDRLRNIKILLVDDDKDCRDLIERMLKEIGACVDSVSSAEEGISRIHRQQFDLLITDLGMPGTDGYAFLRHIRKLPENSNGNIPAIALTAFARSEDEQKTFHAGFDKHVTKPVNPLRFLHAISDCLT